MNLKECTRELRGLHGAAQKRDVAKLCQHAGKVAAAVGQLHATPSPVTSGMARTEDALGGECVLLADRVREELETIPNTAGLRGVSFNPAWVLLLLEVLMELLKRRPVAPPVAPPPPEPIPPAV